MREYHLPVDKKIINKGGCEINRSIRFITHGEPTVGMKHLFRAAA
jgi:hypothetical protein